MLTFLLLEGEPFDTTYMPLSGSVFGSVITDLRVTYRDMGRARNLLLFMNAVFPSLTHIAIELWGRDTEIPYEPPSLLHIITTGMTTSSTGTLRTIFLRGWHHSVPGESRNDAHSGPTCCQKLVGRHEEWESQPPSSLVPNLTELKIEIRAKNSAVLCPCYIGSVLADWVNILVLVDEDGLPFPATSV